MADITITINDAHVTRVVDAFAIFYDYINEGQEDETKAQFAKRMLAWHAKLITKRIEKKIAREAADSGVTEPDIT
jgi:hypothetical protein